MSVDFSVVVRFLMFIVMIQAKPIGLFRSYAITCNTRLMKHSLENTIHEGYLDRTRSMAGTLHKVR